MSAPPSPTRYVAALDVGGTGLKGALIDQAGNEIETLRAPTPRGVTPAAAIDAILDVAVETVKLGIQSTGAPPVAFGAAVLGVVDEDAGIAKLSAALGWRDVPLRERIAEATGLPAVIGHDLRTAAIAEASLGAAKNVDSFVFVAIGTGVGSALVIDGRPLVGRGCAGEIGHIPLYAARGGDEAKGQHCGCGAVGCLETEASAAALERNYLAATGRSATAAEIAASARSGDADARQLWHRMVAMLANGLVAACVLTDPELIVVGGGLALAGDQLMGPLRAAVRDGYQLAEPPRIAVSALGDRGACLGASLLAWRLADRLEISA